MFLLNMELETMH